MSTFTNLYTLANNDGMTTGNWDAQRAVELELLSQINSAVGGGGIIPLNAAMNVKPALGATSSDHVTASRAFLLTGYNSGPAQWIQIYDKNAAPVNGDVPIWQEWVFAGDTFSIAWANRGMTLVNGFAAGNSSTAASRTAGAADCYFNFGYL